MECRFFNHFYIIINTKSGFNLIKNFIVRCIYTCINWKVVIWEVVLMEHEPLWRVQQMLATKSKRFMIHFESFNFIDYNYSLQIVRNSSIAIWLDSFFSASSFWGQSSLYFGRSNLLLFWKKYKNTYFRKKVALVQQITLKLSNGDLDQCFLSSFLWLSKSVSVCLSLSFPSI